MTDRKEHTRAVSPTRQQAVLLSRKSSSEQWTERPVYQRLTVRIFFLKGSECFICMDWLIFKDSHSGKKGLHSVILKMIKPWQGEVKYAACGHKEPLVFRIRCQLILIWSTCFFSVTACKEQRTSALKTGSSLSPREPLWSFCQIICFHLTQ